MTQLWHRLLHRTGSNGVQSYILNVGGTGEVHHRCGVCAASWPQGDEGWTALKSHQFAEHEAPMHYDWRELDGKVVTLAVVQMDAEDKLPWEAKPDTETTIFARDEDGVVYVLLTDNGGPFGHTGEFKWKPQLNGNLLRLMQGDPVSPSSG